MQPTLDEPYVGPRPYERSDRGNFFARNREANELLSLITAHSFVLLYARSGAGKSSLLNAQLIPLLEEYGFEVLPVGRVRLASSKGPDQDAVQNIYITNLLLSLASQQNQSAQAQCEQIGSFLRAIRSQAADHDTPRLLIIDQFEEIFTTSPDRWADREEFFRQLDQALENDPLLRVLLAMREDYIAELDPYASLVLDGLQTRFRLEPLREGPALEAVISPLRDRGPKFDDGVAEKLVEDLISVRAESGSLARGEFVEPVQLQVVCRNLWRNLQATGSQMITRDHLAQFGDVDQVLSDLYGHAVLEASRMHNVRQGRLRRWFEEVLITPAKTRGAVFRGDHETGGISNEVVEDLERERLVVAVLRGGARWYELAHDRLVGPILDSNHHWLLARAGAEQIRRRLEERTAYWVENGRGGDGLLVETELAEFERWLGGSDAEEFWISESMRALVQASRAAIEDKAHWQVLKAERQRSRTLRLQLVVATALIVSMIVLLLYTFGLRRKEIAARSEASALLRVGESRYAQADRLMALKQFEQSALLYASLKDRPGEAAALNALGRTLMDLGDLEKAGASFKKALKIFRMAGDERHEASTLNNLCLNSLEGSYPSEAKEYCRRALDLYQKVGDIRGQAGTLINIGKSNYLLGQLQAALSALNESVNLSRDISDVRLEASARYGAARVWRDLGNLRESLRTMQIAIGLGESLQGTIAATNLGTSLLTLDDAYDLYIDILMRLDSEHPDEMFSARALEASERSRARSLVETLSLRGRDRRTENFELLELRETLVSQLNEKTALLSRLETPAENSDRRTIATRDIEELLAQLSSVDTRLRTQVLPPNSKSFLAFRQIQGQLDDDTLLLEFNLGADQSFLWVVSREGVGSFRLPSKRIIENLALSAYRGLSQRPNPNRPDAEKKREREVLLNLSKILLGPVEPFLHRSKLVIVPDGALTYISFAALPDPSRPAEAEGSQFLPLLLSHSFAEIPSMSALSAMRQLNIVRGTGQSIAVFADPVVSIDDPRIPPSASALAAPRSELASFSRLPWSTWEADAILSLVPPSQALPSVGFEANRDRLFDPSIDKYNIVHFATHISVNRENPELSSLILSLFDSHGSPRNGWIRAYELPSLKLSAGLVVLSGCDAAIGTQVGGEGLQGLSNAFLGIGVPRVIASRWRVDDRAAAALMASFYRYLFRDRMPPSQALRAAQIEMERSEHWSSPYHWAAFTLNGDWR